MGKGWKRAAVRAHENAPRDRGIWIVANIVTTGVSLREHDDFSSEESLAGCLTVADPYEGYARWDEAAQDWLNRAGQSIRCNFESKLHIVEWKEVEDIARNAPESEMTTSVSTYHWDSEFRRETSTAGFYFRVEIYHTPTFVVILDRTYGPFPTIAKALSTAAGVLLNLSVNKPELEVAA